MNRENRIKAINAHMSHGKTIVDANHRSGLKDLAWACALVEQESGGKNIFGGDYGPAYRGRPPFYEEAVTEKRVHELLGQSLNNGVGLTQLTSREYVLRAQSMGGAWKPLNQCLVGFRLLHSLIQQYGHSGIWHFNGSPAYQAQIEAKHAVWAHRFN